MKSTKEKVSYCIGLETGRSLQKQFSDIIEEVRGVGLMLGLKINDKIEKK
mgnify:CR=1 FL=1